jgi:tritrans,polycis-undecaprenyl-diphosphate synthase [geranylgeranyl-diphosphate specific]
MSEVTNDITQSDEEKYKLSISDRIKRKLRNILLYPVFSVYKHFLWKNISKMEKPKHIGIILDGNRRFSRAHGLEVYAGHELGARKVEEVLGYCWELGIKIVTLYAFSIENFNRSKEEVDKIMEIARQKFRELAQHPLVFKYKVRVKALGRRSLLPPEVLEAIDEAESKTSQFSDYQLNIAIAYGGRAEIVDAVRAILQADDTPEIDEISFEKYLYTAGLPDPDLIIRTSGEYRISGFLTWQSAYSELYFCDVYWPEISKLDLWRAVRTYQKRERRFGR